MSSEKLTVNVGTIGHVDHGRTTLIRALGRVLGEVVVVDSADPFMERMSELSATEVESFRGDGYAVRSRKNARKKKLAELQRKAFLKE